MEGAAMGGGHMVLPGMGGDQIFQQQDFARTRIGTHIQATGPRLSHFGSIRGAGMVKMISTSAEEVVDSHYVVLRSPAFTQDRKDSGEIQRLLGGFKTGDRFGTLFMEPRHVLVQRFFKDASEAKAYYDVACRNWCWAGARITAELSVKSVIKAAGTDDREPAPKRKYIRKNN